MLCCANGHCIIMTQTVESSFHIITIHKHSIAGQVENIPPVSRTKSIEKNRDHLLICHFYSHVQTQENKKDPLHRASNTTTMNHQSRKGTDIHSFIHSYIRSLFYADTKRIHRFVLFLYMILYPQSLHRIGSRALISFSVWHSANTHNTND